MSGSKLQHLVPVVPFMGQIKVPTPCAASRLGQERQVSSKGNSEQSCLGAFGCPGELWEGRSWQDQLVFPASSCASSCDECQALPSHVIETFLWVTTPRKLGTLARGKGGSSLTSPGPRSPERMAEGFPLPAGAVGGGWDVQAHLQTLLSVKAHVFWGRRSR